ncbi:hypothetical protein DPMN_111956 [Dreissena polymorpha]|uniref:Uncharacterized protein n=1 Tax=Dreissena polymorpha TaxID=45954 RepID=A0A9D4KFG2_DREPO|nr:hypothetical protein DPMN_111956 [Dreissena polymorpha]
MTDSETALITRPVVSRGSVSLQITRYIYKDINLLTKFHEDRKINVASRLLTRKNAPPPGSHVFQPTSIIFCTLNVASIVKNVPPLGSHFFQANIIILKLIQDIIETNL